MTITYALIQLVEKIAEETDKAKIITKARVTELITSDGACLMNVELCKKKRCFCPDNHGMLSKCRLDGSRERQMSRCQML